MLNRDDLISHILMLMKHDIDYARWALRYYNQMLPWFDLNSGVRDALKAKK